MKNEGGELEKLLRNKRRSTWDEDGEEEFRNRTSKWEITPRTATQSKRLKWDQTPLGYIRIEDDSWSKTKMRETGAGWDQEEKSEKIAILYSEMSLREINMCLPAKGYKRYDFIRNEEELHEELHTSDLPEIHSNEKDFFMPIFHSKDDVEVKIYKGLLLVKNGSKKVGKHGRRMLVSAGLDVNIVLEKTILMAMSLELEMDEKLKVVELIQHLLENAEIGKVVYVREILFVLGLYVYFYPLRKPSIDALSLIYKSGLGFVTEKIEEDFSSKEAHIREIAGKIVATLVGYFGMKEIDGLLRSLATGANSEAKKTFVKSVIGICNLAGRAIIPDMKPLLDLLCILVSDRNRFVRVDAANGMSAIFNLIKPFRNLQTDSIFFLLKKEILRSRSIEFHAFLRAMSYLCPNDRDFSEATFKILKSSEDKGISELKVFEKICDQVGLEESQDYFAGAVDIIFSYVAREHWSLAVNICVKMSRHKSMASIVLGYYKDASNSGFVSEVFSKIQMLDLEKEDVAAYYEGIRNALSYDDTTVEVVDLLVNRRFLEPRFISLIVEDSMRLFKNSNPEVRVRGLKVVSKLARMLETKRLAYCGTILFENMGEGDQITLSFVLRAMYSIYNSHKFKHASELIPAILPILKSKEVKVVEAGIFLLHTICLNSPNECEKINMREWLRISYELVNSLTSWNRMARKKAIESLGHISRIVGPQEILNILMDNLESEDKHQRTGASIAISVVGEYNEIFSVLPTLLSDYAIPSILVQQGILKAMSYMFQRMGPISKNYIYAMLPVIEDAITDEDPGYRNLGLVLIRHVVLSYGTPRIDVEFIIHLLNLVWTNILDFTPLIRSSFDECMEAFATVLSSQIMYKYVLQGLFHPAKAVRERYHDVFEIMKHFDSTTLSQCFLIEEEPF